MPPPEECQLFNMETAVTTLETMVSLGTAGRAATPQNGAAVPLRTEAASRRAA